MTLTLKHRTASVLLACAWSQTALLAVSSAKPATAAEREHQPVASSDAGYANSLSRAFQEVAETTRPHVVNISSARRVKVNQQTGPLPGPLLRSPFRDFFGDDLFQEFFSRQRPQRGFVQQGVGTGFVVSRDGYILTNEHVVRDADEVTVRLLDDRRYTATVVGTDPKTDLAVIKVDTSDLEPAALGDSDSLAVGEWVVAVGNPFGLSHTVTAGIVSAKGRANVGIADYEDFIQTDAAINPGNSGGPLVNLAGEVVGINTAIATKTGSYMGVGFAIPINMAKSIMGSLIESGRVVRGWLGIGIQDLDQGLAESFDFEGTDGALVGDVTPDSPADTAGIKQGDIVTAFDGKPIRSMHQLRNFVAETRPGANVRVDIFRSGKPRTVQVKIGELETQLASDIGRETSVDLGMTVKTLTPEIGRRLGYEELHGVLVTAIEPLGLADRAGIRPNDLIISVQGTPVEDVSGFRKQLGRHDLEQGVRLRIQTGAMQRFVFMRLKGQPAYTPSTK